MERQHEDYVVLEEHMNTSARLMAWESRAAAAFAFTAGELRVIANEMEFEAKRRRLLRSQARGR